MEALNLKSGTFTAEDYFNTSEDERVSLLNSRWISTRYSLDVRTLIR